MSFTPKNILASLLLTSFLMVAFFGFTMMANGSNGTMQADCPFSTADTSLCPQDALMMVVQHISAYQSLLNVPVDFGMTVSLLALFALSFALALFVYPKMLAVLMPARVSYSSPPFASYHTKQMRWLSLFENSPTLT